jgi:replicative DNA helicase
MTLADDPFAAIPTPAEPRGSDEPPAWMDEVPPPAPPVRTSQPEASLLTTAAAELALIGELLIDPSVIDTVADKLHPRDFSDDLLGRVFGRICQESAAGRSPHHLTITPLFAVDEDFGRRSGAEMLAKAYNEARGLERGGPYAEQIAAVARRRRLITGLLDAIAEASDLNQEASTITGKADTALTAFLEGREEVKHITPTDCVDEVIASFDRPRKGVRCGIVTEMDLALGPLNPGDLIIVAGRPGMGKTATAISYMWGAANLGHPVLFISAEMSWQGLGGRLVTDFCCTPTGSIPYDVIRDGRPSAQQRQMVHRARDALARLPLRIQDQRCHTLAQIRRAIRRRKRQLETDGQTLELVIVDYLQLISPDTPARSEYEAVTEVSRTLKAMAKDENVAIMALSQLSRAVEQRGEKRPQLSDLRQSGQIEQDADAVLFLLSPEYYIAKQQPDPAKTDEHADWERQMAENRYKLEFICAKRRNGPEGIWRGLFFRETQAVRGADFFEQGGR